MRSNLDIFVCFIFNFMLLSILEIAKINFYILD